MKNAATDTHDKRINAYNLIGPKRMTASTHVETVNKWFNISARVQQQQKMRKETFCSAS